MGPLWLRWVIPQGAGLGALALPGPLGCVGVGSGDCLILFLLPPMGLKVKVLVA